jgi:hypothetical protein
VSQVDESQDAIGLKDNRHIAFLLLEIRFPGRSLCLILCPMADAVINRGVGFTICDLLAVIDLRSLLTLLYVHSGSIDIVIITYLNLE